MQKLLQSRHGFLWVTLLFFTLSLIGHWVFAWITYVDEQIVHNVPIKAGEYFAQTMRDTLENWQSEFLQLIWQVAGLAYLLYIGSPQSKEGDERKEEKIDEILRAVNPKEAVQIIGRLDTKFRRQ
jgi:hypothetical protein